MTELMGGATPITWRLLGRRMDLARSERAVMRALTVLVAFCWLEVTTRVPT